MFLMSETMPKTSLERLLRYSSTDLSWCEIVKPQFGLFN